MIKIHHGESKLKRFFKIAFIVILVLIGLNFIISLFSSTTFSGPQAAVIPITGEITTYGSSGLFGGDCSIFPDKKKAKTFGFPAEYKELGIDEQGLDVLRDEFPDWDISHQD